MNLRYFKCWISVRCLKISSPVVVEGDVEWFSRKSFFTFPQFSLLTPSDSTSTFINTESNTEFLFFFSPFLDDTNFSFSLNEQHQKESQKQHKFSPRRRSPIISSIHQNNFSRIINLAGIFFAFEKTSLSARTLKRKTFHRSFSRAPAFREFAIAFPAEVFPVSCLSRRRLVVSDLIRHDWERPRWGFGWRRDSSRTSSTVNWKIENAQNKFPP